MDIIQFQSIGIGSKVRCIYTGKGGTITGFGYKIKPREEIVEGRPRSIRLHQEQGREGNHHES